MFAILSSARVTARTKELQTDIVTMAAHNRTQRGVHSSRHDIIVHGMTVIVHGMTLIVHGMTLIVHGMTFREQVQCQCTIRLTGPFLLAQ